MPNGYNFFFLRLEPYSSTTPPGVSSGDIQISNPPSPTIELLKKKRLQILVDIIPLQMIQYVS